MSDDNFSWLTSDQIFTRKRKSGVSSLEILALPDDLRLLVNQVMRNEPLQLQELIEILDRPEEDVRGQAALLTAQGWLQEEEIKGQTYYRVHLKRRRARSLPPGIWQVLEGTWKIQLFRYFSEDEKVDFTRAFKLVHFETDQELFAEGEWGYTMFLIDAGQVELFTQDVEGEDVVLTRLKSGDTVGEAAVLLGERRSATARATEPVSAWTLHKDDLDRLLARSPSAGLAVQREIERQIRGLDRHTSLSLADRSPQKRLNPLLVVGPNAPHLARDLARYTGERLLVLDLHPPGATSPALPKETQAKGSVTHRAARHLDGKELTATLRQALQEFDRVIVATPTELHGPLMGTIGLIELVIDLSDAEVPWIVAAARRRWRFSPKKIGAEIASPIDTAYIARRLCERVVGLALSGGAARTLAHIGVLRALEEAQIPIDMIASTGLGAVIAGLYAAGLSTDELTDLVTRRERDLNPFDGSLSLRFVSRSALYAGKRARNALGKILADRTFADLRLPLYVVVADLETGQPIVINNGSVTDALEASLALAGLVAPAEITLDQEATPSRPRLLVDGGLLNPLPANVLATHGAGLIIGVSTIPRPIEQSDSSLPERVDLTSTWLRLRDQLAYTTMMDNLGHLDVLVIPRVDSYDGTAFEQAAELIAAGLTATQQEVDYIQRLLAPDI